MANLIDPTEIEIDLMQAPLPSGGFKSGYWKFVYKGKEYKFFCSVPHTQGITMEQQIDRARGSAAVWLKENIDNVSN